MTSFTEIDYDKPIIISKHNFSCDTEDKTIPEPLPRSSFSMLIIGKPGMGKTTLILSLLCKQGKALNRNGGGSIRINS